MFSKITSYFSRNSTETEPFKKTRDSFTKTKTTSVSKACMSSLNTQKIISLNDSFILVEDAKSCHTLKRKFFEKMKGKAPTNAQGINKTMQALGGVPLLLGTSQKINLNGMSFKAEDFLSKLQQAGVRKALITTDNQNFPTFVVDSKSSILGSLRTMGFLSNENSLGLWEEVKGNDGKSYLVTREDHFSIPRYFGHLDTQRAILSEPTEINCEAEKRKTVVLNGGIFSRYESNHTAKEVAKFLSLGFNVVISEDKHESKDKSVKDSESRKYVMANRDAIHRELKFRGVENEDIIWKGTCFSSVPAAESAAKYPGSHLISDQGYVNSSEVINDRVTSLFSWATRPFVKTFCRMMDFNYEMTPHLEKIQGNILVIRNHNDAVISEKQHHLMMEALEENTKAKVVTITDQKVNHADHWFRDATCNEKIEKYLISNGMTPGKIL